MKLASLLFLLLLAACDSPTERLRQLEDAQSAERIEDIARDADIAELQREIEILREQIQGVRLLGLENAENAKHLRSTVNTNATISNNEKVAEMTAAGACGTRVVSGDGWIRNERIPCTLADLK